MKQRLMLLKIDSVIDVITNSSSELFVCKTDISVETTKEILASILDSYNQKEGTSYTFDETFGEIEIVNESNIDQFIDNYVDEWGVHHSGWNIPQFPDWSTLSDQYEKEHGRMWEYTKGNHEQYNKNRDEYIATKQEEWKKENLEKTKQALIGTLYILSEDDNSIPYGIWGKIESTFNAERYHLG